jgi:8-amino-7-oxononanoate synthase
MDELSHACMHAGAQLSGARIETFIHNDVADARRLLADKPESARALLLTETVFSMDGDQAPLVALGDVCEELGAIMMTDDAHGFGVVKQDNPAAIQMGTLSKAVGVYGGYVCAPQAFIELLISRARSLVYTTGLPPQVLGAAIEAVDIIMKDASRSEKVMKLASMFCDELGLDAPQSAIVPILLGEESVALNVQSELLKEGYHVSAIRPPTVPAGTSRLRITFSATHTAEQVKGLATSLKTHLPTKIIKKEVMI